MAVLNLVEEGSNGNKTSLCLETRTWRFAKEDLQNTTFEPYM